MMTAVALCTAAYAMIAVAAVYSLRRMRLIHPEGAAFPFVSVLVAARNEVETLPDCLQALSVQDYPAERYEVIVIDDHSSDGTCDVAVPFGVRCIPADEAGLAGKAGALHSGIKAARGEIIAITDADCRPPSWWLRRLCDQLQDGRSGVVCGVTTVRDGSFKARIQGMDWLLLLGVASGLSELGVPVTAMGNNMCFRRGAYDEVGGYPKLPSSVTEDYALFRAIRRRTRFDARLILHDDVRNETLPLNTWKEVLRQRKRWLRGGLRADLPTYVIYLVTFLAHLGPLALLVGAPWSAAALIAVKWAADALVLFTAANQADVRTHWSAFPAFELYLTGYIVALPFLLALSPRVTWKDRRH